MTIAFPSSEFDDAVASACHGTISQEQAEALNALLRINTEARDEYILRIELHARLLSEPDLFTVVEQNEVHSRSLVNANAPRSDSLSVQTPRLLWLRRKATVVAFAACLMLVVGGWWFTRSTSTTRMETTGNFIAMVDSVVDADWGSNTTAPQAGMPLEPGKLRLQSGLAQLVFYSGARIVIQGPAELDLISANEAMLHRGMLAAEVPPQARGFITRTERIEVRDLGAFFGIKALSTTAEVHVFEGRVAVLTDAGEVASELSAGSGVAIEDASLTRTITADVGAFETLFDLNNQSAAADIKRYRRWREVNEQLDEDPSLLVHLDPEKGNASDWRLRIAGTRNTTIPDATVIGCQWTTGRWPEKRALEFQSVNDRVRLSVPGEYDSLTLATWVRVQGLDRQINSLFMSDGFAPGTIHWSIRHDGVLAATVIGHGPRRFQLVTTPPAIALDRLGMWIHLAVVIDGEGRRVTHFLNGQPIREETLRISPPFLIGASEVGNWNPEGFPGNDPFHIRNFSGAMDDFLIFARPLDTDEILSLYSNGKPQASRSTSTPGARRSASLQ